MQATLAGLQIPRAVSLPDWRAISSFEFEGALTHRLVRGGAYGGGLLEEEARALSRKFVDGCFGERRGYVVTFAIDSAWTPWFDDVAWDGTFLCYDPPGGWTCLFITDTD